MAEQRKTRILAIFGNVAWMGQERMNFYVLDLLQKTGRAECLLAVNDRGVQWHVQPHLEAAGLKYRKMRFCWNIRKTFNLRHWWLHLTDIIRGNAEFYRIWREFQPDYLHCGNAFQVMTLLPVLTVIRTPLVFYLGDQPVQRHWLEGWLWRRLIARVEKFVCISRFIQDALLAVGENAPVADIVYNFPPDRKNLTVDDRIPRAEPRIFTVVYMGQITGIKGVDLLIDAAVSFLDKHPDARFMVAGPNEPSKHQPLVQELMAKVRNLDLEEKIIFTGMIENIPRLLELCHVHICPSVCDEALSIVVPEAKQACRPSIIFPSGGLPELVTHGCDGYVCSEKTSAAILTALEYYHDLPDWGRAQGEAAHASLERLGISRERFLAAWLEVYGLLPVASEKRAQVTEPA